MNDTSKIWQCAIIGAGPCGISAAMQLNRYNIKPLLFESGNIGGLLRNANLIENYPGLSKPLSGSDLAERLQNKLEQLQAEIKLEKVSQIDYADDVFSISTSLGSYQSRTLLIATGTQPKKYQDIAIPAKISKHIFYEVYPLRKIRNKSIVIVGAGDAAFDYALNLSRHHQVTIINRGQHVSALKLLQERVRHNDKIAYLDQTAIKKLSGTLNDRLEIDLDRANQSESLTADYLIFAIGREPCSGFMTEEFSSHMKDLQEKEILYLAGDLINGINRQAVVAAGQGVSAAMRIYRKLEEYKH